MSNEALGWVFKHSPYEGTKRVIHLAVADVVNDVYGNVFWMSNDNLAVKANCSRQTANTALASMVGDGYLEVVGDSDRKGRGRTVQYRFVFLEENVKSQDILEGEQNVKSQDILDENVKSQDILGAQNVKFQDTIPIDNNPSKEEPKETSVGDEVQTIWDAYIGVIEKCNLPSKKLTHDRKQLIKRRLNDWSVEQLVVAVQGLEHSSWHRGDNDNGKSYESIELIFRNASKIEQFISYHDKKPNAVDKRRHVNDAWGRERLTMKGKMIDLE